MTFLNKKEEVIKIKLTQFGKELLSKGNFKPEFYQFFDDDILYDGKWAGLVENQNDIQQRIKDTPSTDVQYSVTNLEEKFSQETKQIESGLASLFKEIRHSVNTTEKEKLLSFPLSTINLGSQQPPMFNLSSIDAKIANGSSMEYLSQSGVNTKIPQLEFTPTCTLYRDATNPSEEMIENYDSETYTLDFSEKKVEFLDKTYLEYKPESVTVILDETSVPYVRENFEIEIYEVFENEEGEVNLVQITDESEILDLFEIKVDETAAPDLMRKNTDKNFFIN